MSSTTTRVSLYKPAGGENVNVTTDLHDNLDKLDTNLNFRVVASATARNAISPFWEGLNVRETDTGRTYVSNGSAPISASWSQIPNSGSTFDADLDLTADKQLNIGSSSSTSSIAVVNSATSSSFMSSRVSGDSQSRLLVDADGTFKWGPGGATVWDTNLYRSAADVLATDDSFQVGPKLIFGDTTAAKHADLSSSTTVANTTTETVIATLTIPANDMVVGATYRVTAWGVASVTGTPTLVFKNRIGGVAGNSNGTITITASSGVSNKVWRATFLAVCLTTGASGTWHGNLEVAEGVSVAGANPTTCVVRMDGNSTVSVDTTASQDMVITADWGTASASNTLTCRGFLAERIS